MTAVVAVTIEPAGGDPSTAAALAALDASASSRPWSVSTFTAELARDDRVYLTARVEGRLVGVVGLAMQDGDAHVMTFAVDPAWQHQGIARRLLAALLDEAQRRGAAVTLEVRATDERTRRLYRRAGFEDVGVRRDYYGPGADAIIAWRR
ncbi:MAG: ribosomal protein S18-alanine N-acetyltransferase [Nitriliruptoraceae bacterium]